jgi:hypothetical protein
MFVLASSIVDWSAIWKICLVVLAAGAGTVVIFGFMLLGLKFAGSAGADGTQGGPRVGGLAVAVLCGGICIGIIALGIYAMTQK